MISPPSADLVFQEGQKHDGSRSGPPSMGTVAQIEIQEERVLAHLGEEKD